MRHKEGLELRLSEQGDSIKVNELLPGRGLDKRFLLLLTQHNGNPGRNTKGPR